MGGKTSTTTQQVKIPPEVLARYNAVNTRAEGVAQNPFQIYGTDPSAFVAQLNQQQGAGIERINQASGAYQPYFDTAAGAASAGMASAQPQNLDIERFLNPYQQQVIDATMRQMGQANEQAQSGALGTAVSSGAFGGDRAGIAAANLANQQGLAMGSTLAGLNAQNYQQALGAAQQQQGVQLGATQADLARLMQGGQFYAGLGQAAQQAGIQGGEAQINAGTLGQQTEQAGLSALYNQFMQQQAYPFQVAQFLANIAMGTGALSGSTTATTQPAPFFSDRRLKEDVRRIGHTDDGLPIYKFKYKGDDSQQTHIGFMADEVEQVKPEAVGVSGGYKTVDYDRATKATGGGVAGPYGASFGSENPYGAGYVPQAILPVGELMVADGAILDNAQKGLAQQLASVASIGESVQSLDKSYDWAKKKWGNDETSSAVGEAEAARGVRYAAGGPAYLQKTATNDQPVQQKSYLADTVESQEKDRDRMMSPSGGVGAPQSGAGALGTLLGGAGAAMSGFASIAPFLGLSDRRAKHDIRRIGKTDHGLPIYSFKYKGDDREQTHIGFMADEVEDRHPNAVSTGPDGMKRVDYDQAHKFYQGGVVRPAYAVGGAETEAERRLRLGLTGDVGSRTDALPSGVVPPMDRIDRPVSYQPKSFDWKSIVAPAGGNLRAYDYDQATGMVRDGATGQYITNAREAESLPLGGVRPTESFARDAAVEAINSQRVIDAQRIAGEAGAAAGMFQRAADAAARQGSSQSPEVQFPDLYRHMVETQAAADAAMRAPSLGSSPFTPQSEIEISHQMRENARAAGMGQRLLGNEPPASLGTPPLPVTTGDALRAGNIASLMPPQRSALGQRLMANEPPMSLAMGLIPAAGTPLDAYEMSPDDRPIPVPPPEPSLNLSTSQRPRPRPEGLGAAAVQPAPVSAATAAATSGVPYTGVAGAGRGYTDVILPDGTVERREGARNWRNNNPGNIEYGDFAKAYGAIGSDGRFAVFPTYEAGRAAKGALLFSSEGYAGKTIASAIAKYAPASDSNDPASYAARVAAAVGVDPNTPLSDLSPAQRETMLTEMERVEGGGAGNDFSLGSYSEYSPSGQGATAGAPERRGLAAGLLTSDKPYDERTTVGKMFYNEDGSLNRNALLSLASGVGAMLSSPSQFFLPSLGLGMQGFASTYAGLEKQAADIGLTREQTRRENIAADRERIYEGANGVMFINLGGGRPPVELWDYIENPEAYSTGDAALDAQIRREAEAVAARTPQPAGIFSDPSVQTLLDRETANSERNPNAARAQSDAIESAATASAAAARSSIPSILTQADAVSALTSPDAEVRAGALGPVKQTVSNYLNDISQTLSQMTGVQLPVITDPNGGDAATNAQIILKEAVAAGMISASGIQELQTIMSAQPNVALTAEANSALMAGLLVSGRADMRRADFMRDYKAQPGNTYRTVIDAGQAFQNAYGDQILAEKAALKELIHYGSQPMPPEWAAILGDYKTPMEFLMTPGIPAEDKSAFIMKLLPYMGVNERVITALNGPDGAYIGNYFGG
jgi:hypothetical protein